MTIAFVCPNGHQLTAPTELAGKAGKCPKCGSKFLIPTLEEVEQVAADSNVSPSEPQGITAAESGKSAAASGIKSASGSSKSSRTPSSPSNLFVFLCPNGHKLNGPPSLKGKLGQCPHCGAKFRIPTDEEAEQEERETPVEEAPFGEIVEEQATDELAGLPEYREEAETQIPSVEPLSTWHLPPPPPGSGHRLAELFAWMWVQREPESIIELVFKDGHSFTPKLFSPALSQDGYGVFLVKEDFGRYTMTTFAWNDVAKVVMRNLEEIPTELFE